MICGVLRFTQFILLVNILNPREPG